MNGVPDSELGCSRVTWCIFRLTFVDLYVDIRRSLVSYCLVGDGVLIGCMLFYCRCTGRRSIDLVSLVFDCFDLQELLVVSQIAESCAI